MIKFNLKKTFANACNGKIKDVVMLASPFVLMDLIIRVLSVGVSYRMPITIFPSILFSVGFIGFIAAASMTLGKFAGRIFYGISFAVFFIMFFVHSVYYPYTGFFFSFRLLESASEGSAYIGSTLLNTSIFVYLYSLAVLATGIFVIVRFPCVNNSRPKALINVILVFSILIFITPFFLGTKNKSLKWDTWRNPRNVYESFSDSNKCIKIFTMIMVLDMGKLVDYHIVNSFHRIFH